MLNQLPGKHVWIIKNQGSSSIEMKLLFVNQIETTETIAEKTTRIRCSDGKTYLESQVFEVENGLLYYGPIFRELERRINEITQNAIPALISASSSPDIEDTKKNEEPKEEDIPW